MTTNTLLLAGLSLLLVGVGCNQADPLLPGDTDPTGGMTGDDDPTTAPTSGPGTNDDDGTDDVGTDDDGTDDGTDDTGPAGDPDFYPLVDGGMWVYRHTTKDLEVWDEIIDMQQVEWAGGTAFEARDNPGGNGESTAAILVRDGGAVMRVHKDVDLAGVPLEAVDYDPGFLRFDHDWVEGETVVWDYERTAYDGNGMLVGVEPRTQIFTIESMSVEVTVPAGTFECVQFVRERLETGELKRFWFADGVGKVKHETLGSGATEELIEYTIP